MKKSTLIVIALLALCAMGASVWAGDVAGDASQSRLVNPGFEGDFAPFGTFQTALVAEGWTPWWLPAKGRSQSMNNPAWQNRMPEYKPAAPWANRVHSGQNAQQVFTAYGTHTGGVYQIVAGIEPGSVVRFTIWGHAWAGDGDDPDRSEHGGPMHMAVGIDPTGGTSPFSSRLVWSPELNPLDEWALFEVEVTAQGRAVTVFTRSAPEHPTLHNDVYWDNANLVIVAPAPSPTTTPRAYFEPGAISAPAETTSEQIAR